MKLVRNEPGYVSVQLTRRNLLGLLAKLDGHPPDSACSLVKRSDDGTTLFVRAVEDDVHYAERSPGGMHFDTEEAISS